MPSTLASCGQPGWTDEKLRDHLRVNLRFGLCAVAAATLSVVGLTAPWSSPRSTFEFRATQTTARVTQVKVPLLGSVYYTGTLGVADGNILVGDETSSTLCRLAKVDPVGLRVISNDDTSCTSPSLDGTSAMPVESLAAPKSRIGLVRIATNTSGTVHLGPVVMSYLDVSTSLPEWTYGGGYLWLYDTELSKSAESTQRPAEVLRISLTTGRVLATVVFPSIIRVELAANEDGLWVGRSQETTSSGSKQPALLYFVGTRAKEPKVVIKKGEYVSWLAAAGSTAWATLVGVSKTGADITDTFSSSTSKPHVATLGSTAYVPVESGQELFDAQPVQVNPGDGLFFIATGYVGGTQYQSVAYQRIFTFNPTNGRESKIASIRAPKGTLQASIVYHGSLYLLIGGESIDATLIRVRP